MRIDRRGEVVRHVQSLCHLGAVGGLTDGELLDRFLDQRGSTAEMAFETLVERHGPMVLRVCRSILRDEHEAQDALQATFLVLVRRASTVRKRDSVGSWLHGAALKVSTCASAARDRRRRHERRVAEQLPMSSDVPGLDPDEARILHQELGRLPEPYRSPIVLCYLEGRTCEEVARQLGWPVGTIKSRLSRGRERLANRLVRRGFGPSVVLLTLTSMEATSAAGMVSRTLSAVGRGGPISSSVSILAKGALRAMFVKKIVAVAAIVLVAVPIGAGMFRLVRRAAAAEQPRQQGRAAPKEAGPPGRQVDSRKMVTGTVIGPDGRPARSAELLLMDGYVPVDRNGKVTLLPGKFRLHSRGGIIRGQGKADADGRFRFEVTGRPIDEADRIVLFTHQPGAMVSLVEVTRQALADGEPIQVQLGLPQVAQFTVFGPDGRPVEGARIEPTSLSSAQLPLPPRLRELAGAVTDERGQATIEAFRPDEIRTIRTTSARFGMQQYDDREFGKGDGPKVVNLMPTGSLKGQVFEAEGKPAGVRRLVITTLSETIPGPAGGVVEVTSDAEGRFEVPILPAGLLYVRVHQNERNETIDDLNFPLKGVKIEADQASEVVLRLDQATPTMNPFK